MSRLLASRRDQTKARLELLRSSLESAQGVVAGKACVYLTGSAARGEAGRNSDLDLFIVGLVDTSGNRRLSRLDEIVLKAELIQKTRDLGWPDFSGDGQYLDHYTVDDLCSRLGTQDDDARNTFTARLLLLLESAALLNAETYERVIGDVISAYWRDFSDHAAEFVPVFLTNDIIRLWKTFCVNYEARNASEPAGAKAKRKLGNYKLKHSRMLTCYSAILYLSSIFSERQTVTPGDALAMTRLSPTARLEWLKQREDRLKEPVDRLLAAYDRFLERTDATKQELIEQFKDSSRASQFMKEAGEFGDMMFEVLKAVTDTRLYRFLVV